jgi:hypothetical protein
MSGSDPNLASLGKGPWATFLYGPSRAVLGRVAWALARANDPTPFWVDIQADDGRPDPGAPPDLGWINPDQLFLVAPRHAKPQSSVGAGAIARVIRSDEAGSAIADLSEFLRLPPSVQEMISLHAGGGARPALVIANADRVRSDWPTDVAGVRPILDVMVRQEVVPIFTATPPPGPGRMAFDFVFEIRGTEPPDWRSGVLYCEKAPAATSFRRGDSTRLVDIPEVRSALTTRPTAETARR